MILINDKNATAVTFELCCSDKIKEADDSCEKEKHGGAFSPNVRPQKLRHFWTHTGLDNS